MLVQLGPRSFFFPDNFDLYFKCSVPCLCGIFLPPKMITIVTQQQYSQCPLKVYENYECGFISGLYPVLLIYMSVFMPVPYCFDCHIFVIKIDIRKYNASSFVLSQDGFGYLNTYVARYEFQHGLFCEECYWNFEDCTESVDDFGWYEYFNGINSFNS